MPFETEGRWMESLPFHETAMTLWNNGFDFDAVSDRQLADAKRDEGPTVLGGNRYGVMVVPPCRTMPPETMWKLVELDKKGARVIFLGSLPADVPGLGDLSKRRAELLKACDEFKALHKVGREGI